MKRWIAVLILLTLVFSLCACEKVRYTADNIHRIYDREWIIGQGIGSIQGKYGPFIRQFELDSGEYAGYHAGVYYVNYDAFGFDPSYVHDSYFIVFNEDGYAIDAWFEETSRGG